MPTAETRRQEMAINMSRPMKFVGVALVGVLGGLAALGGEREVVRAAGPWEMAQATAPEKWMPAVVPGTVLTTLVRNGLVPDPYYGLNNRLEEKRIPDLASNRAFYEATFRSEVEIPASFAKRVVWMRPEGINYRSEIYLNGKLATSTRGMFARNAVDVTSYLRPGRRNEILVKVWPVDHPGTSRPKKWGAANGEWRNGGDGEIGRDVTMLMSAGWDFTFNDGIRDRNAGIWRDITFFATGKVRLDAPYVRTHLSDDLSEADLTLEIDLHNGGNGWGSTTKGRIVAEVEGTDVRFEKAVSLFRGERRTEFLTAKMAKPELWWPRNKGGQRLYTLRARFVEDKGSRVSDEVKVRFGVREVTSDQSGKGGARQFYVNRRKVFVRGTNWIPEAMLKADDRRMEQEVRLTAESGVNLVRLWAGGIVESDRFYELCDEYGLLVWQEFWMTGDTRHPDDPGLYLDCVAAQVKRIRAHAALAHWVCSNESTEVCGIEALVKKLTGTTSWMMQSECDGVHDGSPYFPVNPMGYYADTASPRGSRVYGFSPEYGTCALPAADQCRTFMPEELLWPVEKNVAAWKYREGGGFDQLTEFHHAAVNGYGKSATFDEYARKSQAADALAHRALWEAWNRARNEATGVLFWYNNTPIPQLGSHAWDYDLDQTASFFAQKSALEPLHAQYEYLSNRVSVVSDIREDRRLEVRAEVYDLSSRRVWTKTAAVEAKAERCTDVFTIPFGSELNLGTPHFIKLWLLADGRTVASTFYWRSDAKYGGPKSATGPCVSGFAALANLPPTKLSVRRDGNRITVVNDGARIAFLVNVQCYRADGRRIVPVRYSDNFLSLTPGERAEIEFDPPEGEFEIRAEPLFGAPEVPDACARLQAEIDRVEPKEFARYRKGEGAWPPGSPHAAVFGRLDAALDTVAKEVRETVVTTGRPAVWLVYNMGVVVKTKTACFTIDLSHRLAEKIAPLVDFALITHNHADHYTEAYYRAIDGAGKVVISSFKDNAGVKDPEARGRLIQPQPREFDLKGVRIRATFTDHSRNRPELTDFTSPFEIHVGDYTIFHTGDCANVQKLNPTRRPDLWIAHPRCGMRLADGVKKFRPVRTVIGHLNELGHVRDKNRWTWKQGFVEKAAVEAAGGEAVVPLWGDRVI